MSTAREQVLKLLTTDWLVPEGETSSASHSVTPFFLRTYSLGNTLQPTDACGNWDVSASCSSQNSSSACTRSSFPRGHTYPSALLPQSSPYSLSHHLYQ